MASPRKDPDDNAADTATYIGGLARELRAMAAKANLGFLAYLLAMVADDAEATARRIGERKAGDA
jgi:hypothetical protein